MHQIRSQTVVVEVVIEIVVGYGFPVIVEVVAEHDSGTALQIFFGAILLDSYSEPCLALNSARLAPSQQRMPMSEQLTDRSLNCYLKTTCRQH